jgi:hypothetical protein
MRNMTTSLATCLLGLALAPTAATAGSVNKVQTQNAATACTLSVPTTDTKVRPKAIGFRNEGTTNAFVICGFDIDSVDPGFHSIDLVFASIDGAAHTFNCTAASRFNSSGTAQYLVKAVNVGAGGNGSFSVSDTDVGYDPNVYSLYPWGQSITCLMPPGVAVLSVQSTHDDEDSAP